MNDDGLEEVKPGTRVLVTEPDKDPWEGTVAGVGGKVSVYYRREPGKRLPSLPVIPDGKTDADAVYPDIRDIMVL